MKSANQQRWAGLPVFSLAMVLGLGWIAAAGGCVGTGGGSGNGNDNGNMNGGNSNDNSDNGNAANDNSSNDNNNANINGNANSNDNGNSNSNGNDNGGANSNGNDNSDNGNDNGTPTDPGLVATTQRAAFQSQCAQNVLECTTIWPEAVAQIDPSRRQDGQAYFTLGNKIIVNNDDGDGSELVPLRGDLSELGDEATTLTYAWSHAATDGDKCTLTAGPVFSTDANPLQRMAVGFHYVRLTVTNDNIRDIFSDECGLIAPASGLFDFVEFEIEVRD